MRRMLCSQVGNGPVIALQNILNLAGCLSWKAPSGGRIFDQQSWQIAFETTADPQVQADEAEPQSKAFRNQA
jgi:hypothetical protein